jgi:hypothetical protein
VLLASYCARLKALANRVSPRTGSKSHQTVILLLHHCFCSAVSPPFSCAAKLVAFVLVAPDDVLLTASVSDAFSNYVTS